MKKTIVFLAMGMTLILLLGLAKSNSKMQWNNSECEPGQYWQRVKDYEIIHEPNLKDLQEKVKNGLDHGWRPMGGISIVDSNYFQVMVK
jgi:hypothetical protein